MARHEVAARRTRLLAAIFLAAALAGCAEAPPEDGLARQSIVHGKDDRREYFEVEEPLIESLFARSVVALMPRDAVTPAVLGLEERAESFGERAGLCAGERFFEQPSAAFCTGVLVDWDLVLAAGHCAHVLSLTDYVAVFGYYYRAQGELALTDAGVHDLAEVVHERLGDPEDAPRLDHVWLRLREPVESAFEPAWVHVGPSTLEPGDPLTVLSTVGGVPLKIDDGGVVRDPRRDELDYFIADTDTSEGSSGGGAFDADGTLLGILVRGGTDNMLTPEGCQVTVIEEDPTTAEEQFTYASRAVGELCADEPSASSLCRADCEGPCRATTRPTSPKSEERQMGCALGGGGTPFEGRGSAIAAALLALIIVTRRKRSAPVDRRR